MLLHNLITYKVAQFLNRILALRIELQNALFEEFEVRLESKIEQAIAAGTYEVGVETLKADSFRVLERQAIYTHPQTWLTDKTRMTFM